MGPSPIVKLKFRRWKCYKTRRPPRFQPASSCLLVWRDPERRLQNRQSNRAENDAKDFSLLASGFLRLFYLQQVNGERCSDALQHPFWGGVSLAHPAQQRRSPMFRSRTIGLGDWFDPHRPYQPSHLLQRTCQFREAAKGSNKREDRRP